MASATPTLDAGMPGGRLATHSNFSNYSGLSSHSHRSTHSTRSLDSTAYGKQHASASRPAESSAGHRSSKHAHTQSHPHVSSQPRMSSHTSSHSSSQPRTHSSSRPHGTSSRRRGKPVADTIDSLDLSFGQPYHHGGPYDATLASVNRNKKYSPLEAVKDSNMEALKATPREYIADSLQKHVPLQGISTIPPGMPDMSGRIMNYREGADLMREPDAAGGAYKRYDFIPYHDEDLKGKGEPSFTIERALKEQKAIEKEQKALNKEQRGRMRKSRASFSGYEMQDQRGPRRSEYQSLLTPDSAGMRPSTSDSMTGSRRAVSASGRPESRGQDNGYTWETGLQRHDSTGHRLADGLKRRLGSLRRK